MADLLSGNITYMLFYFKTFNTVQSPSTSFNQNGFFDAKSTVVIHARRKNNNNPRLTVVFHYIREKWISW